MESVWKRYCYLCHKDNSENVRPIAHFNGYTWCRECFESAVGVSEIPIVDYTCDFCQIGYRAYEGKYICDGEKKKCWRCFKKKYQENLLM